MRALIGCALLLSAATAEAQNLGHRMVGTVGLHAGDQTEPGVAVIDQVFHYGADQIRDRNGDVIPIMASLSVVANMIGAAGTLKLGATYLSAAAAFPLAHLSVETDRPEVNVDLFGLADIYVQPIKLGWRLSHFDLVMGYGFYAPTGRLEPGGRAGLGQGQWSHEFGLGGTLSLDWFRLSALISYDLNQRKQHVDITRGETLQIQGGAGARLFGFVDVGLAGYALWQVGDDRGSDLPQMFRGIRSRVFGLGPELDVLVPPIRTAFGFRYERDFSVEARPDGQIFAFTVTFLAWQPADRSASASSTSH